MSGLAALLHRDGSPVSAAVLDAMSGALGHRGPDGCDSWREAGVGVAHQHFRTTPEEANEVQPLACPAGRVWLALDGRLDNRDDLLPRREAFQHVGADGAIPYAGDEIFDDLKVDVGLQKGQADLPQGFFDIGLGQLSPSAKLLEDAFEALTQILKHERPSLRRKPLNSPKYPKIQ